MDTQQYARSEYVTQLGKMSFDEIFDLSQLERMFIFTTTYTYIYSEYMFYA